jgi:hypothetical protein
MAKRRRESVPYPTKSELKDASKELRKGHPAGGRVMREGRGGKGGGKKHK